MKKLLAGLAFLLMLAVPASGADLAGEVGFARTWVDVGETTYLLENPTPSVSVAFKINEENPFGLLGAVDYNSERGITVYGVDALLYYDPSDILRVFGGPRLNVFNEDEGVLCEPTNALGVKGGIRGKIAALGGQWYEFSGHWSFDSYRGVENVNTSGLYLGIVFDVD